MKSIEIQKLETIKQILVQAKILTEMGFGKIKFVPETEHTTEKGTKL